MLCRAPAEWRAQDRSAHSLNPVRAPRPPQVGGVGAIPEAIVEGIEERGSYIEYKANVKVRFS